MQRAREEKGWSVAGVAGRLSIPIGVVEQWEQGKLLPSPAQWERVRQLFNLDIQEAGEAFGQEDGIDNSSAAFLFVANEREEGGKHLTQPEREHDQINGERLLIQSGQTAVHGSAALYDPDLPLLHEDKLIGRNELLSTIKEQIKRNKTAALYGLPGSGKTALAVALAHDEEIETEFSDGVLWAGIGRQPHFLRLFSHWGTLLGIDGSITETLNSADAWATLLRDFIGMRKLLIVIDDAWQLEEAQAVQIGGPNCAYLLTTRVASVATSFTPDRAIIVSELPESDGLTLLARFAPTVLKQEEQVARQLVSSVGGLPLALTLMGKYLRFQAASGRPRRLKAALNDLQDVEYRLHLSPPVTPDESPNDRPEDIPISLQSVIAVSDQRLDEPVSRALHALSILPVKPHTFGQDVARIVSGEGVETLDILCDAGLMEQISSQRYMLHQTIADYARMQIRGIEPFQRLINYSESFLIVHQADEHALERELDTIIVALEYAFQPEWQAELVRCACLLAPFLLLRGFYPLAEQILQRAYEASLSLKDKQGLTQITFFLGTIEQKRGEYTHARDLYQEGLRVAEQMDDRGQTSHLLIGLGALAKEQGDYEIARNFYQEGLLLARQMEDQEQISLLLISLGALFKEQGDYIQARELYQEGLTLARYLNDREQMGIALRSLGVVESEQGNYERAEDFYQQGLVLARQLEHRDLMSNIFMSLGNLAKERGQYNKAESYLHEGLDLARQMGHRERISVMLSNLGVLADARSDYAGAEAYLREGLDLARNVGHRERISLILLNLGVIVERQGKDQQAELYYREALDLARQLGHRERISLLLLNLGDLAIEQDHCEQAEVYLNEGMSLAKQISHQERISDLYLRLGIMTTRQGKEDQAQEYLNEGLRIARQINNPLLICTQLYAQGELSLQKQQPGKARYTFREILVLAPADSQKVIADARYGLARVAALKQNYEEARRLAESSLSILNTVGHRRANTIRTFLKNLTTKEENQQL